MDATGYVYRDLDFPMGLCCPECWHVFQDGEEFSSILVAFQGDVPVTRLVCPSCAVSAGS